jgi:putative endonuclease
MFYVYVLYSIEYDKIYIGFTANPEARLKHHNHPQNRGWTSRYRPWDMKYREEFCTKQEAMSREKQLKSAKGRQFIKSIIHP